MASQEMVVRLATALLALILIPVLNTRTLAAADEGTAYIEQVNTDLKYIKECNKTAPIGLAAMNAVLIHQKLSGIGDENFKCFLHCLYEKYNWMDGEGSFLLGAVKESLRSSELPPAAAQWLLYRCTSTNANDPCQRALDFTQCFWSEAKQAPQHDDVFDFDAAFRERLFLHNNNNNNNKRKRRSIPL